MIKIWKTLLVIVFLSSLGCAQSGLRIGNSVNLNADQQEINPFIRMESIHVELTYVAVINISMRETSTGNEIWAGRISRIHRVSPGEYMHEERARGAFLETFQDLLSHYPAKD